MGAAVSQRLINFALLVGFSSSGPLSGGFAPPAAQANLRSVFHDFKACATLRILHFYIEFRGLETKNANCRWQKLSPAGTTCWFLPICYTSFLRPVLTNMSQRFILPMQILSQGRIYDKIVPITDKITMNNVIFVVFIHI